MARIAGVDLPREKAILYALPLIYGVGKHNASKIIEQAGLDPTVKVKDLSETDVAHLREILDRDYQVEGDLRREVNANIRRLIEIGSYRGLRHRRGLPTRGQNTRSNARSRKGPKKTVAGKKKAKK
jgi:small subunit ribosomal protein S13